MAALLGELTFLGLAQGTARLVGPRPMVQAARAKAQDIEALFRQAAGRPIKVVIEGAGAPVPVPPGDARRRPAGPPPAAAAEPDPAPAVPQAPIQEHPLVRQAIEQLGATFVRAQPRVRPAGET
jgi:hypothetical protein